MNSFYIEAYGCSRRLLDAERIKNYMLANGADRVAYPSQAEHIIIVTCALTSTKAEECFLSIKRLQQFKGRMIVYGCLPQMFSGRLRNLFNGRILATKSLFKIDAFFPEFSVHFHQVSDADTVLKSSGKGLGLKEAVNSYIASQITILKKAQKYWFCEYTSSWPLSARFQKMLSNIVRLRLPIIEGVFGGIGFNPSIASIRVSEGCSGLCSYCGIKNAIGRITSKPISEVQEELKRLVAKKQYLLNICSSDLGAYGVDINSDFSELIKVILKYDNKIQIAFLQDLNPLLACRHKDALLEFVSTKRIQSILMPIQSGSKRILGLMRRDMVLEEFSQLIQDIRKRAPEIRLKTQVIVGFPTEIEEDLQKTVSYLSVCAFDQVDFFAYHEVEGTEATHLLPKVPKDVIQRRLESLLRRLPLSIVKTVSA